MSHNVKTAAFGRNIPAWHRLGKVVAGLMTVDEVMKNAELDYQVEKVKAYYLDESEPSVDELDNPVDGVPVAHPAEGCFLTLARWKDQRPTVLGQVGERYTVLQNSEAFKFFEPLIQDGEAVFDAAGVLGHGERVWVLAKIPGLELSLGSGDKTDKTEIYMLVTNSHDGSSAVECATTPIRVVCQNTLNWALQGTKNKISIRHTQSVGERVSEASRALGVIRQGYQELGQVYTAMAGRTMKRDERASYVADVLGIDLESKISTKNENILVKVAHLLESDPLADKDTVWGAYNALTAYVDHQRTVRDTKKANGSAKLKSIWFGSGAAMKEKAFKKAVALMKG